MKLVIDIPEDLYNNIITTWGEIHPKITEILKNAIPLEKELENIKKEILEQKDIFDKKNQFQHKVGLSYAYDIIDKHIDGYEKGKEEKQTNTAEMIGEKAELGKMNELTVQTASVLEEIKAEIENHFINADNRHLNDLEYGQNQGLGIAFDIIDKHIAERSSE